MTNHDNMDSKYEVSQAAITDLDELTALFDKYRIFYGQPSDLEGAKVFLFDRYQHAQSVIYIAREVSSGRAIGFAQLYPTFSSISMQKSWVLNDLYVLEDYRGQGIASQLLEHVEKFAWLTKAKGVALSTAIDNVKAQSLYERFGYVRDNEFYDYFLSLSNLNSTNKE